MIVAEIFGYTFIAHPPYTIPEGMRSYMLSSVAEYTNGITLSERELNAHSKGTG